MYTFPSVRLLTPLDRLHQTLTIFIIGPSSRLTKNRLIAKQKSDMHLKMNLTTKIKNHMNLLNKTNDPPQETDTTARIWSNYRSI